MAGYEIRIINEEKGKGLFATKHYKTGDIIFDELPLVSCQFAWNEGFKYEACDYCMRPLETAEQNVRRLSVKPDVVLSYPECCETNLYAIVFCEKCHMKYCSQSCKDTAYNHYHKTICHDRSDASHPIVQLVETWKQMHYPPETTSVMLFIRIMAMIKQSAAPEATTMRFKQFCHRTVNEDAQLVHKLLGEKFVSQIDLLREMSAKAISGDSLIQEFFTHDGFCSMLALIGTNGQGIGTSPLATWVNNTAKLQMSDDDRIKLDELIDNIYQYIEDESGTFLNSEGSGLYELQSTCNHNCLPNSEATFPYGNHCLQLKAVRDINPEDEITISYLDECALARSRHSRQKELATNYLFTCDCNKCLSQACDPDVTSAEEMSEEDGDLEDMSD